MKVLQLCETGRHVASRLSSLPPDLRQSAKGIRPSTVLTLHPEITFQTWQGFGGALTEAACFVLGLLSPSDREKVLADHFGPRGQRYTLARSHLNSCDFSRSTWSVTETLGDIGLDSFSMEIPDERLIPVLKEAYQQSNGRLQLMITPWSPPGWMKTTGKMVQGGKLLPEFREAWAQTFVKYLLALRDRGIEVWSVTVQNEPVAKVPWESCDWTPEEEADFVVKFLKPALVKAGLNQVKVLIWDHNRDQLLERAIASLAQPGALTAIDGLSFHWYTGDCFDQVAACAKNWPEKLLIFTEGCVEGGPRPTQWFPGERYAHNIFGDINAGAHGWIDWNLALDEHGGPNHVGNFCDAPVLINTVSRTYTYQSSYWYIGHFSRFIVPGARRIGLDQSRGWIPASPDGRGSGMIESTAFLNPDGTKAVIVMNRTEEDLPYTIQLEAEELTFYLPPRSIQTVIFQ